MMDRPIDPTAPTSGPDPPEGGPLQGVPSRLHPSAVAVWTLEAVYALVLIVITGGALPSLGAAILVTVLGMNLLRYLRFRWRLSPESLVIEQGLLRRHRRVIPRDRVQTVDLEVRLRHRLFGVVEVRVEALGGGATQGKLAALDPETAEELRRTLLARSEVEAEFDHPSEPDEILARAGAGRLVVTGLTGGRVGVGAAIVGFGLQLVPDEQLARWLTVTNDEVPEIVALGGARLLIAVIVVALLGGFVLSLVATVVTYWDFTLTRDGDTLRVRRGLLTLHQDTVPYRRIQAVQVEENLPRRILGQAAVRVIVAGRAGASGEEGTDLILPLGSRDRAFRLAGEVAGVRLDSPPSLSPMPPRARRRRMVRAVAGAVVVGGGSALVVSAFHAAELTALAGVTPAGTALWAAGIAGAAGTALALDAYRNLGWRTDPGHALVREGVLTRVTTVVPLDRLQGVETSSSPFQRRRGLATLHLPIARPPRTARAPRALDIDEDEASSLMALLAGRIEGPATPSL